MDVTVADAVRAYPALERIANRDLPQKPAWRVGRWIDKLRPMVERHNRQRLELIHKHGEVNASGELQIKGDAETQAVFSREYDELLSIKESFDYQPVPLSLFRRTLREEGRDVAKDIELNGRDLALAFAFFEDDVGLGE